jgi:hypothetical protein
VNEEIIKKEFASLADQIRKGFASNERQFRTLKSRMAKLELDLKDVKKASNRNSIEVLGLKAHKL